MVRKVGQRSLFFDQPISDADVLSVFDDMEIWLTRLQIAVRLQRAKSPMIVERVERCVDERWLERSEMTMPNGVVCYLYRRIIPTSQAEVS